MTANEYDLILLDWNLPDQTGIDVCKRYRSKGGTAPILMLTARGAREDTVLALDTGVDDYVQKPFDTSELLARVRALLRRPRAVTPDTVRVNGFELDPNALVVVFGESKVELALKESSVLELLMRHPNKGFTPEAIMHKLWPTDSGSSVDTVRTHIKNLRRKLGDNDGQIIRSTRGIGYSFAAGPTEQKH